MVVTSPQDTQTVCVLVCLWLCQSELAVRETQGVQLHPTQLKNCLIVLL